MKVLLILDDGHGMDTPGKRTPHMAQYGRAIKENEFNRPVVDKIEAKAKALGWFTLQTAPEVENVPLSTRRDRANKAHKEFKTKYPDGKCVFVSIHFNAFDGSFDSIARGIETYYYPGSVEGKKLATDVHSELKKGTPQVDRGVKSENFYVVRETTMPAILVEAGFMDYEPEALLMLNPAFQEEVATEVVAGLKTYLNFKIEIDDNVSAWARDAMEWGKLHNLTDGTKPQSPITREQMLTILYRYHNKFGMVPNTSISFHSSEKIGNHLTPAFDEVD